MQLEHSPCTHEGGTEQRQHLEGQTARFVPHTRVLAAVCLAVCSRRLSLNPGVGTKSTNVLRLNKPPSCKQNLGQGKFPLFILLQDLSPHLNDTITHLNYAVTTSHSGVWGPNITGAWQNVPATSPGSTLSLYMSLRAPHTASDCWANLIQTLLHSKQPLKHLFVRDFRSIFILRCSPVLYPCGDILQDSVLSVLLPYRQEDS